LVSKIKNRHASHRTATSYIIGTHHNAYYIKHKQYDIAVTYEFWINRKIKHFISFYYVRCKLSPWWSIVLQHLVVRIIQFWTLLITHMSTNRYRRLSSTRLNKFGPPSFSTHYRSTHKLNIKYKQPTAMYQPWSVKVQHLVEKCWRIKIKIWFIVFELL